MTYESYEPYILQHSANQIDNKLNLINENKNLLPYPYTYWHMTGEVMEELPALPAELKDVGDGSIQIAAGIYDGHITFGDEKELLSPGTYTLSLEVVDAIDLKKPVKSTHVVSILYINGKQHGEPFTNTDSNPYTFDLTADSTVYLYCGYSTAGLNGPGIVIRPQIERGSEKTPWVPYMKNIGNYVDERFNSLNTRFNAVIKNTTETGVTAEVNTIKLGSAVLTEAQLQKILNFIDTVELS